MKNEGLIKLTERLKERIPDELLKDARFTKLTDIIPRFRLYLFLDGRPWVFLVERSGREGNGSN